MATSQAYSVRHQSDAIQAVSFYRDKTGVANFDQSIVADFEATARGRAPRV